MRVLELHNHHQSKGGAMEVLAHEAELLRGAGHDVEEYTLPPAEEMGLPAVRSGLKAIWNGEAFRDVQQRVNRFRPDVVHVHTPFPTLSPAVFQAAHRLNVPAVTTLHSYRYSCIAGTCFRDGSICEDCVGTRLKLAGTRHRCYHNSLGASAALTMSLAVHRGIGTFHHAVDRYLTLTAFSQRLLLRDGIPADRIVVKPNSVPDPGRVAGPRDGDRYVAFAGRLLDIKGVKTMLDAWALASPRGLRLRVAGDGPLRNLVKGRARDDESIEYLGWLDEPDILSLMAGAECVAVPSEWYEGGVPLVLLRSLAVGTPVVVSNLESLCEEVVAAGAGLTFEVADALSMADVLNRLDREPALFRGMRSRARQSYLEKHSPQANLTRLEGIYSEVIAERSSAARGR